jgi:hypothetical protein
MMGAPPQVWVVARTYQGEPDGDPGPWLPWVDPVPFAMTHSRQVDIYKVGDVTRNDAVKLAVFHGMPPWLDPARAFPHGEQSSDFRFVGQSPAGVRMYRGAGLYAHLRNYGDFTIYVLPGAGTWIVANDPAAQRVGATQATAPYEPPPLPFVPGGSWEETGTVDQFTASNPGWLLHQDQVVLKGNVGYPSRPGTPSIVASKKVFREASQAEDAAAYMRSVLARGAFPRDPGDSVRVTGVQTMGPTLLIFSELR